MAPHEDLDGGMGGPRSHAHTDTLLQSGTIMLWELWDGYGIVGDLLVRQYPFIVGIASNGTF